MFAYNKNQINTTATPKLSTFNTELFSERANDEMNSCGNLSMEEKLDFFTSEGYAHHGDRQFNIGLGCYIEGIGVQVRVFHKSGKKQGLVKKLVSFSVVLGTDGTKEDFERLSIFAKNYIQTIMFKGDEIQYN